MQKIEIKYLGPVQELEMDIKDFNLLKILRGQTP